MRSGRKALRAIATAGLIMVTVAFGAPFDGFLDMLRERNIVDVMYRAERSGNVVDSLFKDLVAPHPDSAFAGQNDAMLVFNSKAGTSTMQYKLWNGSAWGSQATTSDFYGSEIRHSVLKYAPTRDEAMLVVLTNTGQVQAAVFDGSSWGAPTVLATLDDTNGSPDGGSMYKGFDIDYEQASGDAVVVTGDGTADPNYHVWNGTSWSLNNNIDIPTTGRPYWIEMAAPVATTTNDTLAFIVLDSNSDVFGMRWDGSAWGNMGTTTAWETAASLGGTKKAVDVAYEMHTGDIMFAWGYATAATAHFRYRAYQGGTLGNVTNVTNANQGGVVHWLELAPDPTSGSDDIMIGLLDAGADLNTFIWTGAAWSAVHTEHSAGTENILDMNFDIEWETHSSNANDAWLSWGNSTTLSRKLWSASAWGTATTQGDDTAFVTLNAQPNNGAFFMVAYEDITSASKDITENRLTGGSQTWGTATAVWGGPVARNLSFTRAVLASQRYNSSTEAMMAYVTEGATSYPQYSRWTGSSWGAVASTSPTSGEIRHMALKAAPTRDELMLVTLGHTGRVEAQVYSGGGWGSATLLNVMNDANGSRDTQSLYRGFDVEYESASGDAIVVTGDGSADPNYHVWDGDSWSLGNNIDIPTTGRPNWIEMAAPLATTTNDALAMIVLDANTDVVGRRWTGSAWDAMGTTSAWDVTAALATEKAIDVAFETGTGDILFIWGDVTSTDQYYLTYSGGALSNITLLDNAQAGAVNNWMRLASNPTAGANVNQILYASLDGGSDLNTFMWSGSAWSAVHTEHTAAAETNTSQAFDIAFETHSSNPDDAWLVYGDGNTVSRKLWNGATQTWGGATTQGDDTDYLVLNAQPNSGAFFLAAYESSAAASKDITQNRLTGGSQTWGTASAIWGGPVARTGLALTQVAIASDRYTAPTFEQAAYRFFDNSENSDVGSALAAQDTAATLGADGDDFRLRMLLHVGDNTLPQDGENFDLQYAVKSGTCDTGFSGETYADIDGTTPIAYSGNGPADEDPLTPNANDPTHSGHTIVNQSVQTSNAFANDEAEIPAGQDGKWDFILEDNDVASTAYCLRVVREGGGLLDTYTVIPEITTAAGAGPSNEPPTASAVSIDSGATSVTLTEGTTQDVVCEGTVTDVDGYADITSVTAYFYRTSAGTSSPPDDNLRYLRSGDSQCVPSGGSGNSETYTCTFPVAHFADATDAGSAYSSDNWTCELHPRDGTGFGTPASDTVEMASLLALDVTSSIAYGAVNANADTGATNESTVVTNTGNRDMDPQISGTTMTSGGNSILASQQKYSDSTFTYSGGGSALSGTPTAVNLSLPARTSEGYGDWYGKGYGYCRPFTMTAGGNSGGVATTTTNGFALVATSTLSSLRTVGNGGRIEETTTTSGTTTPVDVIFTNGTECGTDGGDDILDFYFEKYVPATGEFVAWIDAPDISSTSAKTVLMYYGNPDAADHSDENGVYGSLSEAAVLPLSENPGGTAPQMKDSTVYGNDGTTAGTMTSGDSVQGMLGAGIDLDGTDDRIGIGFDSDAHPTTFSLWAYLTDTTDEFLIGSDDGFWDKGVRVESGTWHIHTGDDTINTSVAAATNVWSHVALVYTNSTVTLYVNGSEVGSTGTSGTPDSPETWIGANQWEGGDRFLNGRVDDARIMTQALHPMDVKTIYNNTKNSAAFWTIGAEQPALQPPVFVQEAETAWDSETSPKTTSSFNVRAGDLLVAYAMVEEGTNANRLGISGGSLSWTLREEVSTQSYSGLAMWTATVDADKSMTVDFTVDCTGGFCAFGGNVLTFRGTNGVGAAESTNAADGAPSLNVTTTQSDSAIVVANADWEAGNTSRTWRANAGTLTEQTYQAVASTYTVYGGYHADAGAAGTYAVGLTAPNSQDYSIGAIEVLGTTSTSVLDAVEDILYWGLGVPNGTPPGSYAGTNTFTAAAGL